MNSKKTHGVVYTPDWIVGKILDEVGFDGGGAIMDPACGDGAFLAAAARRVLARPGDKNKKRRALEQMVHGMDTDAAAVAACRRRLSALAADAGVAAVKWRIFCRDALAPDALSGRESTFDFVVGNPPYVRIQNLGAARRDNLKRQWTFCRAGSTDLYIAFFELGLALLRRGGLLGYVTPNTWLKTHAAKLLRRHLKNSGEVKTLIDFEHHQIFDNITTYSLISILQKGVRRRRFSLVKADGRRRFAAAGNIALADMDEDNWILCAAAAHKRLNEMRAGGVALERLADIHVGITTLADRCYIFQRPVFDGDKAFIKHPLAGVLSPVEKSVLRPIVKASVLKRADEEQNRFVLFPYKNIGGRHRLIAEAEMKQQYPLAYAYLKSVRTLLDQRDRGKPNPAGWYAFGRSQGLDTSFGAKILTSPMNLRPNFIVWDKPEYTFYSGYCIKYAGDLNRLARRLNSDDMAFYIKSVSRHYQNDYKSFAKSFIARFPLPASGVPQIKRAQGRLSV